MSRVPRFQEYLKTGFATEAESAARFRAYANRAQADEQPRLAARWLELAAEKDELAIRQLEAAGKVCESSRAVADALAEDRYENDVLYPKMIRDVGGESARVFADVVARQQGHLERLEELRRDLKKAAGGDLEA